MRISILTGEKGVSLVIALLILLVLTLLGLSMINTTTFETVIAGNDRARVDAFYAAESGLHHALTELDNRAAVPVTLLGGETFYWSGTARDQNTPKEPEFLGLAFHSGSDVGEFGFKRFRVNVTGKSCGAVQEVEVQVKLSRPVRPTTEYNN